MTLCEIHRDRLAMMIFLTSEDFELISSNFLFRHMKEHMDVPIDTSNMSEQELQFHYFKMHDADGNGKLDGCELVKSLIHWHGKQL